MLYVDVNLFAFFLRSLAVKNFLMFKLYIALFSPLPSPLPEGEGVKEIYLCCAPYQNLTLALLELSE